MKGLPRPQSTFGAFIELIAIVAFAIGLALLIQSFLVKPFLIPSASMVPTLTEGQRILADRVSFRLGADPGIGDIIVFHPPVGADANRCGVEREPKQACAEPTAGELDTNFIKRVVAVPGDELYIKDGHAIVNGVEAEEPFIKNCGGGLECNLTEPIVIPPDHYFMMGDNRGNSDDSRFWGPIPRDYVIGQAFATYWPPDRWGIF